jgi:hypothetical protein
MAMLSFKWKHFKQDVILLLVRWYLAYSLSYRDVEELAMERCLKVDHSTIHRWVVEYSPQLEASFRNRHKRATGSSNLIIALKSPVIRFCPVSVDQPIVQALELLNHPRRLIATLRA